MASDLISRRVAIDAMNTIGHIATMPDGDKCIRRSAAKYTLSMLPPAQPEIVRCKDCLFGYRYFDVQNGVTDSWVECRNPEGLNRDVSDEGFCSASCRRKEN